MADDSSSAILDELVRQVDLLMCEEENSKIYILTHIEEIVEFAGKAIEKYAMIFDSLNEHPSAEVKQKRLKVQWKELFDFMIMLGQNNEVQHAAIDAGFASLFYGFGSRYHELKRCIFSGIMLQRWIARSPFAVALALRLQASSNRQNPFKSFELVAESRKAKERKQIYTEKAQKGALFVLMEDVDDF